MKENISSEKKLDRRLEDSLLSPRRFDCVFKNTREKKFENKPKSASNCASGTRNIYTARVCTNFAPSNVRQHFTVWYVDLCSKIYGDEDSQRSHIICYIIHVRIMCMYLTKHSINILLPGLGAALRNILWTRQSYNTHTRLDFK